MTTPLQHRFSFSSICYNGYSLLRHTVCRFECRSARLQDQYVTTALHSTQAPFAPTNNLGDTLGNPEMPHHYVNQTFLIIRCFTPGTILDSLAESSVPRPEHCGLVSFWHLTWTVFFISDVILYLSRFSHIRNTSFFLLCMTRSLILPN